MGPGLAFCHIFHQRIIPRVVVWPQGGLVGRFFVVVSIADDHKKLFVLLDAVHQMSSVVICSRSIEAPSDLTSESPHPRHPPRNCPGHNHRYIPCPSLFESSGDAMRLPQHTGAFPQNGQPSSESKPRHPSVSGGGIQLRGLRQELHQHKDVLRRQRCGQSELLHS